VYHMRAGVKVKEQGPPGRDTEEALVLIPSYEYKSPSHVLRNLNCNTAGCGGEVVDSR